MVKRFVLVFIAFMLWGCGNKEKLPANILPQDKMTAIMIDVHIAEGKTNLRALPIDSARLLFRIYEDSIFKKHKVTRPKFEESYKYYSIHMDVLNKLYSSVVDSLSLREARDKIN